MARRAIPALAALSCVISTCAASSGDDASFTIDLSDGSTHRMPPASTDPTHSAQAIALFCGEARGRLATPMCEQLHANYFAWAWAQRKQAYAAYVEDVLVRANGRQISADVAAAALTASSVGARPTGGGAHTTTTCITDVLAVGVEVNTIERPLAIAWAHPCEDPAIARLFPVRPPTLLVPPPFVADTGADTAFRILFEISSYDRGSFTQNFEGDKFDYILQQLALLRAEYCGAALGGGPGGGRRRRRVAVDVLLVAAWPVGAALAARAPNERTLPCGTIAVEDGFDPSIGLLLASRHRGLLRARRDAYDLFVHNEDDTLIPFAAVREFVRYAQVPLPYFPGFLRVERDTASGALVHYENPLEAFHAVDIGGEAFVKVRGNTHQGMWMATRAQLRLLDAACNEPVLQDIPLDGPGGGKNAARFTARQDFAEHSHTWGRQLIPSDSSLPFSDRSRSPPTSTTSTSSTSRAACSCTNFAA